MRIRTVGQAVALLLLTGCDACEDAPTTPVPNVATLTMNGTDLTVARGQQGTIGLRLGTMGDNGIYQLAVAQGLPAGVTARFAPTAIAGGETAVLTLTGATSAVAAPTGTTITVTATSTRGTVGTSGFQLRIVEPFTMRLSGTLTAQAGNRASANLIVDRDASFSGPVALSIPDLPTGWTASLAATSTSASPEALGLDVPANAAPASYTMHMQGVGGGVTISQTITAVVTAAPVPGAFSIALTPDSLSLVGGSSTDVQVSLARSGTPLGPITLAVQSTLPAGLTASFAPASVAGSASVLTLTAAPAVSPGLTTITIVGTAGTVLRATTLKVLLSPANDFSLTATPAVVALQSGSSGGTAKATIGVQATSQAVRNGLALAVTGLPTFVSAQFASGQGSFPSSTHELTFTADQSATTGSFPLTVVGTSLGISRTIGITLNVTRVDNDFSLSLQNKTMTVNPGHGGTELVVLTRRGTLVNAEIALSAAFPSNQGSAWFSPTPVRSAFSTMQVAVTTAMTPGTYPVVVTGVLNGGTLARTDTLTVTVVASGASAFSLSPAPKVLIVPRGGTAPTTMAVDVSRTNGHVDPVTLSAVQVPANVTLTFSPPVVLSNVASSLVSVTAGLGSVPGVYAVILRGTAIQQRDAWFTLIIQ